MIESPPTLEEAQIPELMIRLRAGDKDAAQTLVLGFTRNAQRIAQNLYKRSTETKHIRNLQQYDVLEAEALYFVVVAVQKAKERSDVENIGGWVTSYVNLNLLQFCYKNHYLRTTREKLKKMNILLVPMPVALSNGDHLYKDDLIDKKELERSELKELFDAMEEVKMSNTERLVLKYRLQGYNDVEVGKKINLCGRRVFDIRKKLEAKFLEAFS